MGAVVAEQIDVGDEGQAKERKTEFHMRLDQEKEDLRAVLALPGGMRLVTRWIEGCHTQDQLLSNDEHLYRMIGARAVGLAMLKEILTVEPKAYMMILAKVSGIAEEDD